MPRRAEQGLFQEQKPRGNAQSACRRLHEGVGIDPTFNRGRTRGGFQGTERIVNKSHVEKGSSRLERKTWIEPETPKYAREDAFSQTAPATQVPFQPHTKHEALILTLGGALYGHRFQPLSSPEDFKSSEIKRFLSDLIQAERHTPPPILAGPFITRADTSSPAKPFMDIHTDPQDRSVYGRRIKYMIEVQDEHGSRRIEVVFSSGQERAFGSRRIDEPQGRVGFGGQVA